MQKFVENVNNIQADTKLKTRIIRKEANLCQIQ